MRIYSFSLVDRAQTKARAFRARAWADGLETTELILAKEHAAHAADDLDAVPRLAADRQPFLKIGMI